MEAKRFHRWWLGACVLATLLANWAGGFSLVVTMVFVVIYATGATLIGRDDESEDGEDGDDSEDVAEAQGSEEAEEAQPEIQPSG